jgi:hypothetical protein
VFQDAAGIHMALAIFDAITIHISRVLEAVFDDLEYRLAKRALRRAAKLKARRRSRPTVLTTIRNPKFEIP